LSGRVIDGLLQGIKKDDVVTTAALERSLKLLSDLPGVVVKSTLMAGEAPGTSSLVVDVTPGKLITGRVEYGNPGNEFTGKNQVSNTLNINNPLGLGDVLSVQALTTGKGLNSGRVSYQAQIGEARVGASLSALAYKFDFEKLELKGSASIASVYANYPLIRSVDKNLYAQVSFDSKRFDDLADLGGKKRIKAVMASLSGDYRDSLLGGGLTRYSLNVTGGNLELQTPSVSGLDNKASNGSGSYGKIGLSLSRLQRVTKDFTVSAAVRGQLATKNLDSSEKFALGGANAVRAFSESQVFGDQGLVVNLEGSLDLPQLEAHLPGRLQAVGFYDVGSVTLSKNPQPGANNSRTLSGVGLGLRWVADTDYSVKAAYAKATGDSSGLAASGNNGRFLLQVVKNY
jgi:hemolysin activation/secretion protein